MSPPSSPILDGKALNCGWLDLADILMRAMSSVTLSPVRAIEYSAEAPSVEANPVLRGAPPEMAREWNAYYQGLLSDNNEPDDAQRMAFRFLQHSGWYQTKTGWQRLGPDIRGRVNVRKAVQQPDSRYLISDVDAFYPNAVKGTEVGHIFSPNEVFQAIENTNRAIQAGGQRPALAVEHPNPLRAALGGKPDPPRGAAINWRTSPRGFGWARCDLVDVDPSVVDEWKRGHYTGLSAGLVHDAEQLNLRFGHVALLGVQSQALSALPVTEIFNTGRHLFFSADATLIKKGLEAMDATKAKGYKTLRERARALDGAFASAEAGEPDAESKVQQAQEGYNDAVKDFMGEMGPPAPGPVGAQDQGNIDRMLGGGPPQEAPEQAGEHACNYCGKPYMYEAGMQHCPYCGKGQAGAVPAGTGAPPAGGTASTGGFAAGQGPQETSYLPDKSVLDTEADLDETINDPPGDESDNEKKGSSEYVAKSEFAALREMYEKQNRVVKDAMTVIQALKGRTIRQDFEAFCADLHKEGRQFSAEHALKQLANCGGNPQRVNELKEFLRSIPKATSFSEMGTTFGIEGQASLATMDKFSTGEIVNPDNGRSVSDEDVLHVLHKKMPGLTFSADDLKLGRLASGIRPDNG
jgi:hypothetical protein